MKIKNEQCSCLSNVCFSLQFYFLTFILDFTFDLILEFIRIRSGNDAARMGAIPKTVEDIMKKKRQDALKSV